MKKSVWTIGAAYICRFETSASVYLGFIVDSGFHASLSSNIQLLILHEIYVWGARRAATFYNILLLLAAYIHTCTKFIYVGAAVLSRAPFSFDV